MKHFCSLCYLTFMLAIQLQCIKYIALQHGLKKKSGLTTQAQWTLSRMLPCQILKQWQKKQSIQLKSSKTGSDNSRSSSCSSSVIHVMKSQRASHFSSASGCDSPSFPTNTDADFSTHFLIIKHHQHRACPIIIIITVSKQDDNLIFKLFVSCALQSLGCKSCRATDWPSLLVWCWSSVSCWDEPSRLDTWCWRTSADPPSLRGPRVQSLNAAPAETVKHDDDQCNDS